MKQKQFEYENSSQNSSQISNKNKKSTKFSSVTQTAPISCEIGLRIPRHENLTLNQPESEKHENQIEITKYTSSSLKNENDPKTPVKICKIGPKIAGPINTPPGRV